MSIYSFQIIERGVVKAPARLLVPTDRRAIWGLVEALALRMVRQNGALIQVTNSAGETVIQAGVRTALTSIEGCHCLDCPLKGELRRALAGAHSRFDDHPVQITCPLNQPSRGGGRFQHGVKDALGIRSRGSGRLVSPA